MNIPINVICSECGKPITEPQVPMLDEVKLEQHTSYLVPAGVYYMASVKVRPHACKSVIFEVSEAIMKRVENYFSKEPKQ